MAGIESLMQFLESRNPVTGGNRASFVVHIDESQVIIGNE